MKKCGCFRSSHFVTYETSHLVTNFSERGTWKSDSFQCEKIGSKRQTVTFGCAKPSLNVCTVTTLSSVRLILKKKMSTTPADMQGMLQFFLCYSFLISISLFMSFKIYLPCLQAPAPVPVKQMECSPSHLHPFQKTVFSFLPIENVNV